MRRITEIHILGYTPDDVYTMVDARTSLTQRLIVIGITILIVQAAVQIGLAAWVVHRTRQVRALMFRVEKLLNIAVVHADITDRQMARTGSYLAQMTELVNKEPGLVRQVVESTALHIATRLTDVQAKVTEVHDRVMGDGGLPKTQPPQGDNQ